MPRATRGPPGWRLDLAGQDARKRALARRGASRAAARCGPGASRVSAAEGGVAACRARLRGASTAAASPPEVGRTGKAPRERGGGAAAFFRGTSGEGASCPARCRALFLGRRPFCSGFSGFFRLLSSCLGCLSFPPFAFVRRHDPRKERAARRRDTSRPGEAEGMRVGRPQGPRSGRAGGAGTGGASQRDLLRPTPAWNEPAQKLGKEQRVAARGSPWREGPPAEGKE